MLVHKLTKPTQNWPTLYADHNCFLFFEQKKLFWLSPLPFVSIAGCERDLAPLKRELVLNKNEILKFGLPQVKIKKIKLKTEIPNHVHMELLWSKEPLPPPQIKTDFYLGKIIDLAWKNIYQPWWLEKYCIFQNSYENMKFDYRKINFFLRMHDTRALKLIRRRRSTSVCLVDYTTNSNSREK